MDAYPTRFDSLCIASNKLKLLLTRREWKQKWWKTKSQSSLFRIHYCVKKRQAMTVDWQEQGQTTDQTIPHMPCHAIHLLLGSELGHMADTVESYMDMGMEMDIEMGMDMEMWETPGGYFFFAFFLLPLCVKLLCRWRWRTGGGRGKSQWKFQRMWR